MSIRLGCNLKFLRDSSTKLLSRPFPKKTSLGRSTQVTTKVDHCLMNDDAIESKVPNPTEARGLTAEIVAPGRTRSAPSVFFSLRSIQNSANSRLLAPIRMSRVVLTYEKRKALLLDR